MFFSCDGETRAERIRRERVAKALCGSCPVQSECLRHALSVGERYGVWGGTSEGERRHRDGPPEPTQSPGKRRPMKISATCPAPGRAVLHEAP
ncbi:WhiB family transcriptional regulator [Rhodococcus koreensis]|uniref:WhiB family transcriptional regulator n=1 Tax=Rhodococcus koreensis TaxID=99653 RepID=UPI003B84745A